jgi:hypothetical protein
MADGGGGGAKFPPWLAALLNILVAVLVLGLFLYFFIWGNWIAWMETGAPTWPTSSDVLQGILSGAGGAMASVFAIALNLPSATGSFFVRTSRVMTLVKPPPVSRGIDWPKVSEGALVIIGTFMAISFPILTMASVFSKVQFPATTPQFILDFAAPGAGLLIAAFLAYLGKLGRNG